MKVIFNVLLFLLFSICCYAQEKGQLFEISNELNLGWITVVNPDGPVVSSNCEFTFGESCIPMAGAWAMVVAVGENSSLCVLYSTPESGGTVCPDGVYFFCPNEKIVIANNVANEVRQRVEDYKQSIRDMISRSKK